MQVIPVKVCPNCGVRIYGNSVLCGTCRIAKSQKHNAVQKKATTTKCSKCGDYFSYYRSVGRKRDVCDDCQRPAGAEAYRLKIMAKDKEIAELKNEIKRLRERK